jgi:hypothetical protein
VLGGGRSCSPSRNNCYTAPSLLGEREMFEGSRQGQHWKRKSKSKDILEETMDVPGVQQWN